MKCRQNAFLTVLCGKCRIMQREFKLHFIKRDILHKIMQNHIGKYEGKIVLNLVTVIRNFIK